MKRDLKIIVEFIDNYLDIHKLDSIGVVKANYLLNCKEILHDSKHRPGKPLRDILRKGLIPHAYQLNGKYSGWIIPHSNSRKNIDLIKKSYIWKLAEFLYFHNMKMSGNELADHLNRNNILTNTNTQFEGGRGIYKLISATYNWIYDDLNLIEEAEKIAIAFVKTNGEPAFNKI